MVNIGKDQFFCLLKVLAIMRVMVLEVIAEMEELIRSL